MQEPPDSREETAEKPESAQALDAARETTSLEPVGAVAGGPTLVNWLVPLLVTIFSFAGVVLLVATRGTPDAPSPEPTAAPTRIRAAAPVATPSATPPSQTEAAPSVRVTSTSGSAEQLSGGGYRVTFTWVLDGAKDGDPAVVRFSVGDRPISEQRGVLGANTFDALRGTLTLVTSQECSSNGWSAELASIRGQPPGGERTATVPGVSCR